MMSQFQTVFNIQLIENRAFCSIFAPQNHTFYVFLSYLEVHVLMNAIITLWINREISKKLNDWVR